MEKRKVKLSPEDHERIKRLHSEAYEKLLESATICARALGSKGKVTKLRNYQNDTGRLGKTHERDEDVHSVEIVLGREFFETDDGYCGLEDADAGICIEIDC
jgi:hypothetical protein